MAVSLAALGLGQCSAVGVTAKKPSSLPYQIRFSKPARHGIIAASCCFEQPVSAITRPAAVRSKRMQRSQLTVRAQVGDEDLGKDAISLRRFGWASFWTQLALTLVSSGVLVFTVSAHAQDLFPPIPVILTAVGVVCSYISTFFAYGYTRVARKVLINNEKVKKSSVIGSVLVSSRVNTLGLAATLVGLQAAVGQLVGKTLASSTSNPYAAGGAGISSSTPTAIDVFSVQASTNTLMAHAISIFFANWLLRTLNKGITPAQGVPGQGSKAAASPGYQGTPA